MSEIRELRQLREENAKLKRLVTDLSLDEHILTEIVRKRSEAGPPPCAGGVDAKRARNESQESVPAGADLTAPVWLSQLPRRSGGTAVADA